MNKRGRPKKQKSEDTELEVQKQPRRSRRNNPELEQEQTPKNSRHGDGGGSSKKRQSEGKLRASAPYYDFSNDVC